MFYVYVLRSDEGRFRSSELPARLSTVKSDRLVYSSDSGQIHNRATPSAKPPAANPASKLPDDGVVRLFREKGKRGGKTVTVIRGLPPKDLAARALELKRMCGAGGTQRDGAVEIQGDHRERIAERLRTLGYNVKIAGG